VSSLDLELFNLRLFLLAQERICVSSNSHVVELAAGIKSIVCEFYYSISSMEKAKVSCVNNVGCRPDGGTLYYAGKYFSTQGHFAGEFCGVRAPSKEVEDPIVDSSGRSRQAIFTSRVECQTMSNALEKSRANTRTNGSTESMVRKV